MNKIDFLNIAMSDWDDAEFSDEEREFTRHICNMLFDLYLGPMATYMEAQELSHQDADVVQSAWAGLFSAGCMQYYNTKSEDRKLFSDRIYTAPYVVQVATVFDIMAEITGTLLEETNRLQMENIEILAQMTSGLTSAAALLGNGELPLQ